MGPVQGVRQSQWGNPLAGYVGRHNQRVNAAIAIAIANTTPNVTATAGTKSSVCLLLLNTATANSRDGGCL
jgi:hypothetical protein